MIRPATAVATLGAGALLLLPQRPAGAEPYLAVRTGFKCSQCHVNRTGGGARNGFGNVWAQTSLPARTTAFRSRSLNEWLAVGTDLRALATAFAREPESGVPARTSFDISEAQIALEARFIADVVTLYVDQSVGPGAATAREAFALVQWAPLNGHAKAGKFMPSYGWRLWDDEAATRAETGFTYKTPDLGFEVGIEPGPLSWFVAVTNGTQGAAEDNDGKMITSSAALVRPRFRIGVSGSHNELRGPDLDVVGGFGGFTAGRLVVLAEADWIRRAAGAGARDPQRQFVAYGEGDLLVRQGVNLKLVYDYHDPDLDTAEDQRARLRTGIELFPVSFVRLAAFYTRFDDAGGASDRDRLTLEAHLHF